MKFTEEERQRWVKSINNNPKPYWNVNCEGKNQLHCGFITENEEKWNRFVNQHEEEIVERIHSKYSPWFLLKNGECWQWYLPNQSCCAYRVWKAKVDEDVDKGFFNCVLSQMLVNCCELEWI